MSCCPGAYKLVDRVGRGLCNTPGTVVGLARGRRWDPVAAKWVRYDLDADRATFASPEADGLLRDHVRERRKFRKEVIKEVEKRARAKAGLPPEFPRVPPAPPRKSFFSSSRFVRGQL